MYAEPNKRELKALTKNASKDDLNKIVEKVLSRKNMSVSQKIDRLLLFDHTLHGELDRDHTVKDKKIIMARSRIIYRGIKKIDKKLGDSFLLHQDDE